MYTTLNYCNRFDLFARTDREKEKWFNLILSAVTQVNPVQLKSQTRHLQSLDEAVNLGEMLTSSERKKMRHQMTFLNIVIARFWYALSLKQNVLLKRLTKRVRSMEIAKHFTKLHIGNLLMDHCNPPIVTSITNPWVNDEGLWFQAEIEVAGEIVCELFNSDDNAEENFDLEEGDDEVLEAKPKNGQKKSLVFHLKQVVEHELLKRDLKRDLKIALKVKDITGRILVNVPPLPSDRVWLAFSDPPFMEVEIQALSLSKVCGGKVLLSLINDQLRKKLDSKLSKSVIYPQHDKQQNSYLGQVSFVDWRH